MKKNILLPILFLLSGCTCSLTVVHTEGTADDVVDTSQSPSNKINPAINVPVQSQGSGQSVTKNTPTEPETK